AIRKKPERTSKSLVEVSDELLNPELFILIKQWRNEKAKELNMPVYLILPQKSIMELSIKLPQTPAELKAVKGFGDKKVQRFGAELLEIISDYCGEKNIKSTQLKF
ncbi:MAG: HRDC domain-containing protein, partial [Bacteroidales bacterium]|nr:HRDC domain-containing protein [Bacteroidales bacterium]